MLQRKLPCDPDEHENNRQFDDDDTGIEVCRLLDTDYQDYRDADDGEERNQIEQTGLGRKTMRIDMLTGQCVFNAFEVLPVSLKEDELFARGQREPRRYSNPEVFQEAEQVTAPTGGDGRRTEGIFQDQVPADDPGEDLAQSRISVGVSRTGNRNQRRKLRVT